jgi:hypothetical protein
VSVNINGVPADCGLATALIVKWIWAGAFRANEAKSPTAADLNGLNINAFFIIIAASARNPSVNRPKQLARMK